MLDKAVLAGGGGDLHASYLLEVYSTKTIQLLFDAKQIANSVRNLAYDQ